MKKFNIEKYEEIKARSHGADMATQAAGDNFHAARNEYARKKGIFWRNWPDYRAELELAEKMSLGDLVLHVAALPKK
jgi:hypothetical protein